PTRWDLGFHPTCLHWLTKWSTNGVCCIALGLFLAQTRSAAAYGECRELKVKQTSSGLVANCHSSPVADLEGYSHLVRVPDLTTRIVGHYEKHAVAWDRDRQSNYWNDKIWHAGSSTDLAKA